MSKSSLAKEMRKMVLAAERQGFPVKTKRDGWMVFAKTGSGKATVHRTPSDQRVVRNVRARLRSLGIEL